MTLTEHPNPNLVRHIDKHEPNLTKQESKTSMKEPNVQREWKQSLIIECRNMNMHLNTLNKNIEFLTKAVTATGVTINKVLGDFNATIKEIPDSTLDWKLSDSRTSVASDVRDVKWGGIASRSKPVAKPAVGGGMHPGGGAFPPSSLGTSSTGSRSFEKRNA